MLEFCQVFSNSLSRRFLYGNEVWNFQRPKGKGGSNKPSLKGLQKSNKINIDEYRDYEYTDDFDIEDDFM